MGMTILKKRRLLTSFPMIYAPLVLVAVLVSARSIAEWSPDVSEISDSIVHQRPLAVGKRRLRIHDEATEKSDEERAGSPPHIDPQLLAPLMREGESSSSNPLASIIESPIPSLMKDKSVAAHLASYVPNKDVSLLKSNIAFTDRMEQLDINVDNVVAAVQTLRTTRGIPKYNDYTLTLMALGSKYFKQVERIGTNIEPIIQPKLKTVMSDYVKSDQFKRWIADHMSSHVSLHKVYGKMRWLVEMEGFKMSDEEDLADMAFGSEFFKIIKFELTLPSPTHAGDKIETLDQLKHQIEQLAKRRDVDPKVRDKLRTFVEDPDSMGKTKKELLRRAKDAVLDDEVNHLKRNEAFIQRMEKLGINIDDVKVPVREQSGILQYDDYSLYWMVLGNEYFNKVGSSNIELIRRRNFERIMGTYATSGEFKNWRAERKYFLGNKFEIFQGKMCLLKRDKHLKLLKGDALANMAFGSEFFPAYKIALNFPPPMNGVAKTLDQLKHQIEQLTDRHDVDPKVREKLRAFAEDPGFIGKTEEELFRRAKDAVLDDEVDRLKSNKAFTQRMEDLKINIDDVNGPMQRLREQVEPLKYDEYSLYLMALGSEYFKNVGANIKSLNKNQFMRDMRGYTTSDDFKRWKEARKYLLRGILENVYGKMRRLKQDEHLKLLKDEELANMAFGSELSKVSESKLTPLPPIQNEDKIESLDQLKHQEQLTNRHDVDPKVREKLRAFAEDPGFIGKTEEELLRRAKDAVLDDEVDRLKSNEAFIQRMEELKINIDDVSGSMQMLRKPVGSLKYDEYSLYLMALGSEYFKKVEHNGAIIESLHKKEFERDMKMYATSDDFKRWKEARKYLLRGRLENLYGKMRLLKHDEHLNLLKGDELANMAFGSELSKISESKLTPLAPIQDEDKIETLDQLKHQIEQMAKQNDVDPKVIDKMRALADDPGSIGKTRKEMLKSAKDAVLDDELDRLKSNEAFTQRMEELKINIDDVNGPMQRLREQVEPLKYDEYSLYLMALGSEYFEKLERDGVNIKSLHKNQFMRDMREYATSDDFKRWKVARKYLLRGRFENLYGKMRMLKHDKHLKLLKGNELANMAFGSELSEISESKLTPLAPIQDEDKIETLDQLNRLINQLPSGGNGEPNVKKSLEDILKKDPKAYIGQTAKQLKRKADHESVGVLLGEETNKKTHVE